MNAPTAPLTRGVYEIAAHGPDAVCILIAVDSRGRRVGEWCPTPATVETTWAALDALLAVCDPLPQAPARPALTVSCNAAPRQSAARAPARRPPALRVHDGAPAQRARVGLRVHALSSSPR